MLTKFPAHSNVVFIGDSITAANLVLPRVIHAYKNVLKTPGIHFNNCGVAGGTAKFACDSFDIDIAIHNPTHAVIAFGINDSNRDLLSEPRSPERLNRLEAAFDRYRKSMTELVDRLLAMGTEVTLCTPVPYDEYTAGDPPLRGGYSLMLGYAEFVRNLAREKGVALYDQHAILSRILATDTIISPDRVHPTEHGYFVLAREFLAAQGIDVGEECPVPDYFSEWHSYVARLRCVLAGDCMIVRDMSIPTDERIAFMQEKLEKEDWGIPVFERYIRAYVADKPEEASLRAAIDRTYLRDIYR